MSGDVSRYERELLQNPAQLAAFERELRDNPALVEEILAAFPPVEVEADRVIRCSRENTDQAVARAIAKAAALGEFWRIEAVG